MPRRVIPVDLSIGERIRARRELRTWSIRYAASRAGVANSTWSRVERGELRANRYLISEFAAALECSVTSLTGQPFVPADRALETAHARVPAVWDALLDIAPDEPPTRPAPPMADLESRVDLLNDRWFRLCDYAAAGQLLPDLLADLHAAAAGPDARAALPLLVQATFAATATLTALGYVAECAYAAERCRQVAERLDDPVSLAVADRARAKTAITSGRFGRSLTLATRATDELDQHTGAPAALEVLGMLHLTSALSVMARKDTGEAMAHVDEAERIAKRTGETTSWSMAFGPTNVQIWRVGLEASPGGDPGRAVEAAQRVDLSRLESKNRQAYFNIDYARALTDVRRDEDAIRRLLIAERTAPQLVRSNVSAREAARFLLHRSGGSALRGLCERMRVAD